MNNKTITVIVAAYNEEANIENTVRNILSALDGHFDDYEILPFDDGSTDKTGEIIDRLAKENPKVKPVHNGVNRGFGYNFNKGVELAQMDYISILPGDNEIDPRSVEAMFKLTGSCDIIVPYTVNTEERPKLRRVLSSLYVFIMNLLFGCELRYYTGPAIHKRETLGKIELKVSDFAFMSSILVRLIRQGCSFIEVPIYIHVRKKGKSKAFRPGNVIRVFLTIFKLFCEVEIFQRARYNNFPIRRIIPENMVI